MAPATSPDQVPDVLVSVVRRELDDAERLDTVEGQAAVALAMRIVSPATSGAAVHGLTRELRATLAVALAGVRRREPDTLDELEARRASKASSA